MYRPLRATSLGFGSSLCSGISPPFLCTQLAEMPPAGQEGGCHLGGGTVFNLGGKKLEGRQKSSGLEWSKSLKKPKPKQVDQTEFPALDSV